MNNILARSRGTKISVSMQRVFLCQESPNIDGRDKIISDLLSLDAGMDVVILYREGNSDINIDLLREELTGVQTLVLWVTKEIIESFRSGVIPVEYKIAKNELNIPILPIAEYGDLFPEFTKYAEAVHGIAKDDLEYRVKLKEQLDNLLASNELLKEIEEKAFSAQMFLSYRKIDITKAREFMSVFHDLKGFEAISIWYDNFLTAGRVFDEEIRESISKCDVFTLLVTPNLLKKNNEGNDNYIVSTEYPLAVKANKAIISVEAEQTDKTDFAAIFPMENLCGIYEAGILQNAYIRHLSGSAIREKMNSEQSYLLGIAYLNGYNVERDYDRAIKLLISASESRDIFGYKAAKKLAELYGDNEVFNYEKALEWWTAAAKISESVFGETDEETIITYGNIGSIYSDQGDYPNAMNWYTKALLLSEREQPSIAFDILYRNIGSLYESQSDYANALEWYSKTLKFREKLLGNEHPGTAESYNDIGQIYDSLGEDEKSLEYFTKALNIREAVLGIEHPKTTVSYNNIASYYMNTGNYPEALHWLDKALKVRINIFGTNHPDTAMSYNNIGVAYSELGRYDEAHEILLMASEIRERTLGDHTETAMTYNNIGSLCTKTGKFSEALEWFDKALKIQEKIWGEEHPKTAITYSNMAMVYAGQDDFDNAMRLNNKALEINTSIYGEKHKQTALSYNNIGSIYSSHGNYTKAMDYYMKALGIFEEVLEPEHPETIATWNNIGVNYGRLNDYPNASKWLLKAFLGYLEIFGQDHPSTQSVQRSLYVLKMNRESSDKHLSPGSKSGTGFFGKLFGKK